MKGSLNTFLNAFTYPDKTVYPVASRNLKDFYNLVDVYLDAVFFPRLGEPVFMQEGWHYELDQPGGALRYKGVVFNEMKGVYSSADSVAMEAVTQTLLPDSTYGVDSGGDPEVIPALTYDQFEKFHRDHYHPSNALAYFYGDDPEPRRLELLDAYFSRFGAGGHVPVIKAQKPFQKPASATRRYAAAGDEESSEGCFIIHAWKLGDCTDLDNALAWGVLNHLLLGSPASPLRRDLLESGLGEEIAGGGFQAEGLHMVFSIGLKGVDEEDFDDVHRLVAGSIEKVSRTGFDDELIEAAFNTIEFGLRENNTGSWPRGLVVLLRALAPWTHGVDPVEAISWEKPLADFKARVAAQPGLFQEMLSRDIVHNTHVSKLAVRPDPMFAREQENREQQRLLKARSRMSSDQLQTIQRQADDLKKMQQEPDTPEALARMPRLGLGDLDRYVELIPKEPGRIAGVEVLHHPQPTSGIVYVDLVFDLRALPYRLLPLLPTFARCLTELGTDRHDFASLARWIGCKTGGIHEMMYTGTHEKTLQPVAKLILRGKAMIDKVGDLLEILSEMITSTRFDQQARLLEFVQEDKAGEESRLIPSGSSFVRRRMAAHYSMAESVSELLDGFEQVRFLRGLVHRCRNDWREVLRDLEHVRHALLNRDGMLVNVTCEADHFAGVSRRLDPFLSALPRYEAAPE
ncbi:MAG: insulinase family protein, partial [Kiritimatiellia bacterium]